MSTTISHSPSLPGSAAAAARCCTASIVCPWRPISRAVSPPLATATTRVPCSATETFSAGIDRRRDALDDVAHALADGPELDRRDLGARQDARRLAPDAHQAALALAHGDELDVVLGELAGQLAQRLQRLLPGRGHVVARSLGLERAQLAVHQRLRDRPAPCSPLPPVGLGMRGVFFFSLGGGWFGGGPISLRSVACWPTVQRLVEIQ